MCQMCNFLYVCNWVWLKNMGLTLIFWRFVKNTPKYVKQHIFIFESLKK